MEVGQTVWHVGKNVAIQKVTVLWMAPYTKRDSGFNPEALVLVEKDLPIHQRYVLIPIRQLSEIEPPRRCHARFNLSLTQEIRCDYNLHPNSHTINEKGEMRHHSYIGLEGAEVYWK